MDSITEMIENNKSPITNLSVIESEDLDTQLDDTEELEYLTELPIDEFIKYFKEGNPVPIDKPK